MRWNGFHWVVGLLAAPCAAFALSSGVLAGDGADGADEPSAPAPLSGPEVETRSVPGVRASMTGEPDPYMRASYQRVPHDEFMKALRSLTGDDAGKALAPTDEQNQAVADIEKEFREARRAYQQEHAREIRGARATLGDDRKRLRGPRAREVFRSLSEEKQRAALRLRDINGGRPAPEPYHVRMWDVLSEDQQTHVERRIDAIVRDREAMRTDRPAPQRDEPRAAPTIDELLDRYASLPAPQQRRVRAELERMLVRAEASAARAQPPSVDDIDLTPNNAEESARGDASRGAQPE